MAMFTLLEINGDHASDLDNPEAGAVLAAVARNPSNVRWLEEYGLHRAVRYVTSNGNSCVDRDKLHRIIKIIREI